MILPVMLKDWGTLNCSTTAMAKGIAIQRIQGRALPYLVLVRSMMKPMMTSEIPSKIREIRNIVPTAAAAIPAELV